MEENKKQKITTPMAIVVAGFLIMVGLLLSKNIGANKLIGNQAGAAKTLSEQVGVSKNNLDACIKATDATALSKSIEASVESAMKDVPTNQRGTPYSVIIGKNGAKAEIRGADTIENVRKIIAEVTAGKVTTPYTGDVPAVTATDHIFGSPDTPVTIIEYSDYECPYCKAFHTTLNQVVTESNGNVSWVYRHWPIHQNSFAKLEAAECVAKLKGNDAFWKYSDLLFGLLNPTPAPVTDQL